jgi:hypothetical protein
MGERGIKILMAPTNLCKDCAYFVRRSAAHAECHRNPPTVLTPNEGVAASAYPTVSGEDRPCSGFKKE